MRRIPVVLLAAGCAANPPAPPSTIPYAALRPASSVSEADRSLGTGPSAGTRNRSRTPEGQTMAIDLPSALALVGAESLALALARERVAEARALAREAEYGFLPSLRPRVSFFRHEGLTQDTAGEFLDVDKQNTFLGAGADLTLDFGGALFRALAARRLAEASSAGAQATHSGVALDVIARYFALLVARDAVQIETEAVALARALLEFETSRRRLGVALEAQQMRARANLAEAEGRLATARGVAASASAALVRALHLDPEVSLAPVEMGLEPVEIPGLDASLPDLFARSFAKRPELEEAAKRVEAAEEELSGASVGPLVPRLRLGASYGAFGENPGSLEDQEVYLAAVEWDLGAALFPAKDAAQSRFRRARLALSAAKDAVAEETVRAREEGRAARDRLAAAEARLIAAEEALRLADARFRQGSGLLLEVLDAQSTLTRARLERAGAIAELHLARFRLLHATGELREGG